MYSTHELYSGLSKCTQHMRCNLWSVQVYSTHEVYYVVCPSDSTHEVYSVVCPSVLNTWNGLCGLCPSVLNTWCVLCGLCPSVFNTWGVLCGLCPGVLNMLLFVTWKDFPWIGIYLTVVIQPKYNLRILVLVWKIMFSCSFIGTVVLIL